MRPPPSFHHLHLNSVDPEAAIAFYVRLFPRSTATRWGGLPALAAPNDVLVLFTKVATPPPIAPQTALWHFGWHVADTRASLETYQGLGDVTLLPLYTTDEGGSVWISSDSWPGAGGVPGRTRAQIAEANGTSAISTRRRSPGAAAPRRRTETTCVVPRGPERSWPALDREGMFRAPRARQDDRPLAPSRGHLYDHIALGVRDLDAWIAKLRGEGVTFLEAPYPLGDTRAVMIQGPSREAIELVETAP